LKIKTEKAVTKVTLFLLRKPTIPCGALQQSILEFLKNKNRKSSDKSDNKPDQNNVTFVTRFRDFGFFSQRGNPLRIN